MHHHYPKSRIYLWAHSFFFGCAVFVVVWQLLSSGSGILVPQAEIEPMPPALEGRFLTTGPSGNSLGFTLDIVHTMGLNKCIVTDIHHYSSILNVFTALKILYALPLLLSLPLPLATMILLVSP